MIRGRWLRLARLGFVAVACSMPLCASSGQIGGQTSADGPLVLDDAEVSNLIVEGVERVWIPDYVFGVAEPLTAVSLAGSGLTLAAEQTPLGALRFEVPSYYGFVDKGFGVPMPAVKGASTLDHPGDITSYTHLSFFIRSAPALENQKFVIILETYPVPDYPKLYWNYSVPAGSIFQEVHVDLWQPDLVQNAGVKRLEELLGATRFLYFYFYGEAGVIPKTLVVHLDDIRLTGVAPPIEPLTQAEIWSIY